MLLAIVNYCCFFVIMWTMDLVFLLHLSSQVLSVLPPHVSENHGADGGFQAIMAC